MQLWFFNTQQTVLIWWRLQCRDFHVSFKFSCVFSFIALYYILRSLSVYICICVYLYICICVHSHESRDDLWWLCEYFWIAFMTKLDDFAKLVVKMAEPISDSWCFPNLWMIQQHINLPASQCNFIGVEDKVLSRYKQHKVWSMSILFNGHKRSSQIFVDYIEKSH